MHIQSHTLICTKNKKIETKNINDVYVNKQHPAYVSFYTYTQHTLFTHTTEYIIIHTYTHINYIYMCTIAITKIITRRELTSWKRELQEVMTDRRGRVSVDFREEGEEK